MDTSNRHQDRRWSQRDFSDYGISMATGCIAPSGRAEMEPEEIGLARSKPAPDSPLHAADGGLRAGFA
jgi:hypothetical protein